MKTTISTAVLALLGLVSAENLKHHKKTYQTVHVDDYGFIVLGQQMYSRKESDWLANGDEKDDLENQSELGDARDPVVMDNGFGLSAGNWADNSWKANHYKGSLNDFVQTDSQMKIRKESDWLANGDDKDDLEVQSELGDARDPVVMDNGFGLSAGNWADNRWKANLYKGSLNDFVQLDSDIMDKPKKPHHHKGAGKKHHKKSAHKPAKPAATASTPAPAQAAPAAPAAPAAKPAGSGLVQLKRESDWIANADAADDKELESELGDGEDEVVFDAGMGLSSGMWADNNYKNDQYIARLNNFVQTEETAGDLFLTEPFKE
jgi:hypothetical protein